jgi:hypothetical protein
VLWTGWTGFLMVEVWLGMVEIWLGIVFGGVESRFLVWNVWNVWNAGLTEFAYVYFFYSHIF